MGRLFMAKKQFQNAKSTEAKVTITPEDAAKALVNWIETMKKGNPDDVAALYAADAGFWGTMADDLSTNPVDAKAYFVSFLGGKNNLDINVDTRYIQAEGAVCLISGKYTFSFDDDSGQKQSVAARYTFTFKKQEDGQILIINHHSSQTPGAQPKPANG